MRTLTANGNRSRCNRTVCSGHALAAEDQKLFAHACGWVNGADMVTRRVAIKIRAIGKLKLERPTK